MHGAELPSAAELHCQAIDITGSCNNTDNMSDQSTEGDGAPIATDDSNDQDTSTDAKGFPGKSFFRSHKKKVNETEKTNDNEREQTDSARRIPRYNIAYAPGSYRGLAVIINNENFHWSTGK